MLDATAKMREQNSITGILTRQSETMAQIQRAVQEPSFVRAWQAANEAATAYSTVNAAVDSVINSASVASWVCGLREQSLRW
jgi:pectin methylesterase-like acyl-CoA thioesterase